MLSYHLFMLLSNLWARSQYGLRVKGKGNIPQQGPYLIVANHFGRLLADLVLMPALWPKCRPVLVGYGIPRQENKGKLEVPRTMVWGSKVFPIIVAGPRALGKGMKAVREILKSFKNDQAVLMMISGEVSWHGRLNSAREAVPWIALRSGVPVLPCSIYGTYDIWPRWEKKPKLTGKITVRIGQPFTLADGPQRKPSPEMFQDAGNRITSEIQQLLDMGH
jgi:1-acyl-sn-glycerol-3-phosphate acyltransferase